MKFKSSKTQLLHSMSRYVKYSFTDEGETEDDLKAYVAAHPHTHVLKLIRKSCRKA
jgi:hypothetical protein